MWYENCTEIKIAFKHFNNLAINEFIKANRFNNIESEVEDVSQGVFESFYKDKKFKEKEYFDEEMKKESYISVHREYLDFLELQGEKKCLKIVSDKDKDKRKSRYVTFHVLSKDFDKESQKFHEKNPDSTMTSVEQREILKGFVEKEYPKLDKVICDELGELEPLKREFMRRLIRGQRMGLSLRALADVVGYDQEAKSNLSQEKIRFFELIEEILKQKNIHLHIDENKFLDVEINEDTMLMIEMIRDEKV